MHVWSFEAIGTAWQIDTPAPLPADVQAEILATIEEFDRTWSRFRDDSIVSAIAREPGRWRLPGGADLLDVYDRLHAATEGAVNPLIGRTLSDLGYDRDYSLRPADEVAEVPLWSSLDITFDTVTTTDPVLIDVGAAGKGALVDRIASVLWAAGKHAATIDASGDLYHCGTRPIRVALEHPADPTRAIGVVELDPEDALCGSATNRRAWGDGLHHVIDGRTGRPATDVVATWVLLPQSCAWADALATAHFFADADTLMDVHDHQFVKVHADGRVQWSPDLPGEIYP